MQVTMTVNGTEVTRDVEPRLLLVHFLRQTLGLTGTHWGCDTSNCGTCVVLVDGEPVKSCTALAAMTDGHEVRTVEGMAAGGTLDPVQQGFMEEHGLQCGFCTPGMMLTARALLDRNPNPDETEIREAISGQICRCTGYATIVRSVQWAAAHPAGNGDGAVLRQMPPRAPRRCRHDRRAGPPDQPGRDRRGPADRLRPDPAQGGPALRPREGPLPRRHRAARDAARRDPALADGARPAGLHRHHRGAGPPEGARRHHRQGPRGPQPGVGADPVGRHDGRPGHRQGPLPGPGGGLRRRRGPLLRPRRARAHRRRVRGTAAGHRRPPRPRPGDGGDPRRQGGQDRQPHLRLGGRRQGRHRRRLRPRRRRRQRGGRLPAGAPGADGDLRRDRRLRPDRRQAHPLRDDAGPARPPHALRDGRRHPGAQDPDHRRRHRRRVRQQGRHLPGLRLRRRRLDRDRQAGEVGRGPLREPDEHLVRPRLHHEGRGRGDARGQDPRRPHARAGRPRGVQRHRPADQVPGRLLLHLHRQLRPRGRALLGHRRLHEQGARRRRLRLLVPGDRGGLPGRADGRRPRRRAARWTRRSCG